MESLRINKIKNYYFHVIFIFSIFETFYRLKSADAFPTISNLTGIPSIKNEKFCRTFSFSNSSIQCSFSDLSNKFFLEEFSNFLNQLSPDQARSFVYLFKDSNLTKAESKISIVKQAFGLPENLRNIFIQTAETSVTNMKLIESELDKISEEKLNPETRAIYFQIKNIYKNDNLTIIQECQQLNTIIIATPTKMIQDLENTFGKLSSTCNENFPQFLSPPTLAPEIPAIATVNNIISPQIYPQWNNNNNPQRYQQQDFNQGLLIPLENKLPINNFDLNQIFGGGGNNNNNNNNIFGPMPLIPLTPIGGGFDLIGTFTEVASLAKNLNNLLNGLQNLYNSNFNNNGYYKIINGANGGIQNGGLFNNLGNPSSVAAMSPYYQSFSYGNNGMNQPNQMNYNLIPPITNFNWNNGQRGQAPNTNSYFPQQTFYYYPPMQQQQQQL